MAVRFNPRKFNTDAPLKSNKYYIRNVEKNEDGIVGWNNCINGVNSITGKRDKYLTVLPNCVGYAAGRFNEIYYQATNIQPTGKTFKFDDFARHNAEDMMAAANHHGLKTGSVPDLGAMMVWKDGPYSGKGHVAIVEYIGKDSKNRVVIRVSESGYKTNYNFRTREMISSDGSWDWAPSVLNKKYKFAGFIYNPAITGSDSIKPSISKTAADALDGTTIKYIDKPETSTFLLKDYISTKSGGPLSEQEAATKINTVNISAKSNNTKTTNTSGIKTVSNTAGTYDNYGTNLLTYPSFVESPFISVKFGDYTFGTYNRNGNINKKGSATIDFPNYMSSIHIVKTNGTINQYTINMEYQIRSGDDPNYLDKIFGKVGYGGKIYISYGDWTSPAFSYKNEEAIITKIQSSVNFASSKINYTINATSSALSVAAISKTFTSVTAKPSDIIIKTVLDKSNGLQSIFTGMTNETKIRSNHLIASDDKVVKIPTKENTDPLSYINYLVSCMVSNSSVGDEVIHNSAYFMNIVDNYDSSNIGGTYFKVSKITSNTSSIQSSDTYVVDVGYPDNNNLVTNFQLNNDTSYSLLYNYSSDLKSQNYVYNIDNDGNIVTQYSPDATTSKKYLKTTNTEANWWSLVTQFPITATLTIKGLVRPAMLMTYIRINSVFYGNKHLSSGLYVVTKQEDIVDYNGYRTVLTLLRVGGDNDYVSAT